MSTRFLIGKAELLTKEIPPQKMKPSKKHPYTFAEAKAALLPQLIGAVDAIDLLPSAACPNDLAVTKVTLHPAYIAKSYFPVELLRHVGLESVGSRTVRIQPRKSATKTNEAKDTTQLFVAGTRSAFRSLVDFIGEMSPDGKEAQNLIRLEAFQEMRSEDRIRNDETSSARVFELGLHVVDDVEELLTNFTEYAESKSFIVNKKYQFHYGRMLFLGLEGPHNRLASLAEYSLIRVVRPMPSVRISPKGLRAQTAIGFRVPNQPPLSREPRVAILDGGLPAEHVLGPYVRRYFEVDPAASDYVTPNEDGPEHGLAVTSAALFGPLIPGGLATVPFASVDHYRVLDSETSTEDPYELYRTLGHIEEVLLSRQYQFINLSLGPALPVDDDDVHAWTAVIDSNLADGETVLTVAAGNNGHGDSNAGLDRIQVPADSVNALTIGACSQGDDWDRAPYSARGPGRTPGRRKPDVVSFGGAAPDYFHVVRPGNSPELLPQQGTSFAAPAALRYAVGIRAILGEQLSPLAIRALLVHGCEPHSDGVHVDTGYGRVGGEIEEFTTCPDGSVRIIYQGTLRPGKYLRAPIPLPARSVVGKVRISATFAYGSPVDPQDSSAYTKAGLEISFRPRDDKKSDEDKQEPDTKTFFSSAEFRDEHALRSDIGKWETVLSASRRFLPSSLKNPAFDIHYNARDGGQNTNSAEFIRYALVVTLHAPKDLTLHEDILATHRVLLELEPVIQLPAANV